ncbi:hypothetical protein B0H14DRAFT_2354693 [Mycena olivaceomarginata]|nr:hypothetical protein B0H14DRAFT_2354693 [Mycena olivaceomarginata]
MKEITPSNWDDWPTRKQLEQLSGKANGLFHYAATAVQWIKQQIDQYGESCRSTVFKEFAQMGIEPLEELYKLILISLININKPVRHAAEDARRCQQLLYFQQVVGTILVLQKPFTIHQITVLLADIPKNDFDVCHFLQQMRSVLIPGTTTSFEEATPQMHKSFRDYIMDGPAPAEFRILAGNAHFVTARSCLEVIFKARSQSDVVVNYSVQHWYKHLRKAVEGGMAWEDERMWKLLGQMVEEAVVGIWATSDLFDLFVDVATAGWGLLKEASPFLPSPMFVLLTFSCLLVSSECVLFPHHPCLSCSFFLAFSSLARACFSPIAHPYPKIWKHGLLQTWKHQHSPLFKYLCQYLVI